MLSSIRAHQPLLGTLLLLAAPAWATFANNGDGTVTDSVTGLMWDLCSWGQTGTDCSGGTLSPQSWVAAMGVAVTANTSNYRGYNDWRLPNIKELESLVDRLRSDPAIDPVFTNNPTGVDSGTYWSSTYVPVYEPPEARNAQIGYNGQFGRASLNGNYQVRLVRSGQSFDALTDVNINADIATATITAPDYTNYRPAGGQTPYTYGSYSFTLNTCQKNPPPPYNGNIIKAFLHPWSATATMTDRNAGQYLVNGVVNRSIASPPGVGSVVPLCTAYTGDTCTTPLTTWTVNSPLCHSQKYTIGVNTKRFSFYIDFYSALSLAN